MSDSPAPRAEKTRLDDHAELTVWSWGDARPDRTDLIWAHATGFEARTYTPLLNELAKYFNVRAWDMRGHGASHAAANPTAFRSWNTYYRDMGVLLDQLQRPAWLLGHSIGATTALAATLRRPEKVLGLILCEPVLADLRMGGALSVARLTRQAHKLPMAAAAQRRRAVFKSRELMFQAYRRKTVFRNWPDNWLQAYVDFATRDRDDGQIELACDPSWEARTFATTEHNPWRWMHTLEQPVHVLAGSVDSTFPAAAHARFLRKLPGAKIEVVNGANHFLPMEHAALVVARVRDAIAAHVATCDTTALEPQLQPL